MLQLSVNMVEEISKIFMDVQTELVFFALAIGTHLLFFSKLRPAPFMKGHKQGAYPASLSQKGAAPGSNLSALKSALKLGDINAAMAHVESLHSLWKQEASPSSAPGLLMDQLVKLAGQKQAMPQLLQLLTKLGLLGKTFELVLAECAEQSDAATLKEAEKLGRSQGVHFTAEAYQALMKGASNCGSQGDARRIMQEAQESGIADVPIHTAYMHALMKWGRIEEVHKVLHSMRAAGFQPSCMTFNKLLSVAVTSDASVTWKIVDEMKAFGVKPDQVSCSILLKNRCISSKVANLEKVIVMLESLDTEIDEVLFNSVVDVCVRLERADLLMPVLKQQRASKHLQVKSPHTYGSIIRAYGYVQDMQGAWDTWHDMRRQHIAPISVTLGCMVEALVTNGDIEGGYELIHEMLLDAKTAPLVNAVMYGSIIKGFSHMKCFARMWEVYDEMIVQKLQFSMVTFNTLIDACARSGELNRIPSLLKDIEAQGLKMGLVTYSAILKGYCQKNLLEEAFELFDNMTKTTQLEPDEIMYNTLLDGCARQGLYARGMEVFNRMRSSGVRPSNYTLSVLVKLANRGKKLEKAFELCDELSSTFGFRMNVHVLANLVQACIQHHDLPRAVGVLERMLKDRVRPDVRTYSMLLRACIESRKAVEVDGLLRAATGLRGAHPRLAKYSTNAAQPQGGLPGDLVSEILSGLMDTCHEEHLAAALLLDLGRLPSLKLDPKLRLRLAARMADAPKCA